MPTKDEDLALVSLLSVHPADVLPYFRLNHFLELFPTRKAAAKWCFDFWEQNQQLPKLALLKKHYPSVNTLQAAEPIAYCYGILKQQYIDAVAAGAGEKMTDALDKKDMTEFLKHNSALSDLITAADKPLGSVSDDTDNFIEQLGLSLDKDSSIALKVMPTGFKPLDDADGGGLRPGHIYVLASLVNLGKTYVSLQIAENLRAKGYRVIYTSTEMPKEDLSRRAIAVRFGLNVDQFVKNEQPKASIDAGETKEAWYKRFLQEIQQMVDADTSTGKLFIRGNDEGALTPRHIKADIQELNADVVVIDAAQDIRDNALSKDRTPALYNAVTELNSLVRVQGVALLVTVQLDSDVEKKGLTQGNLNRIQWAQVFAQKAHIVIMMLGSRDSAFRDMTTEKTRDGKAGRKWWLNFDFPCVKITSMTTTPGTLADLEGSKAVETVSELEQALLSMDETAEPASTPPARVNHRDMPVKLKATKVLPKRLADPVEEPPAESSTYERRRAEKASKKNLKPWQRHGK